MSNLEQENLNLCFDIQTYELRLLSKNCIEHSKVGDPMRVFKIRKGDTAPVLRATLLDKNAQPVYISDRNTIQFVMREQFYYERDEEQIAVQNVDNVSIAPQTSSGNQGIFQYNWAPEDTAEHGSYIGVFKITLNGVESQSVEIFELTDGMTLEIEIDGGAVQTITFDADDFTDTTLPNIEFPTTRMFASAQEIVSIINTTLTGGIAFVSGSGTKITIQTDTLDLDGSVKIGGTANDIIRFDSVLTKNRQITLPEKGLPIKIIKNLSDD